MWYRISKGHALTQSEAIPGDKSLAAPIAPAVPAPADAPVKAAPMGAHAAGGAAWSFVQMAGSKVAGLALQLAMGLILSDDKGAIGVATTVTSIAAFTSLFHRFGLTELLVKRQRHFNRLVNIGFWMGLASGLVSGLLSIAAGAVMGYFKGWDLLWLMAVYAMIYPIDAFAIVPNAKLRVDLRFKTQSLIGLWSNILVAVLTIIFLCMHMGAMAIILPRPIQKIFEVLAQWYVAPVKIHARPQFYRWRLLFADGMMLSLSTLCMSIIGNGDYVALAIFNNPTALGVYTWAFNLSTQTVQLFGTNLSPTLFTVFTKLQDELQRQADAYLRSSRALAILAMPLCVLQAAVAAPLLHLVFGHKWDAAIPVLQISSIAMGFIAAGGGTLALLQSQGRFKFILKYQFVMALVFWSMVIIGAIVGNEVTVSLMGAIVYVTTTPLGAYVALKPAHTPVRRILAIYIWPFFSSLFCCALPVGLVYGAEHLFAWRSHVPSPRLADLFECIFITAVALPLYIGLTVRFRREDALSVWQFTRPLFSRLGLIRSKPAAVVSTPAPAPPPASAGGPQP